MGVALLFQLLLLPKCENHDQAKRALSSNRLHLFLFLEKNEPISSIGVENIVSKTWEKKINSIPSSSETSSSQNDLDIPSFLRKNKNKNM